jgi:hypothetical protein
LAREFWYPKNLSVHPSQDGADIVTRSTKPARTSVELAVGGGFGLLTQVAAAAPSTPARTKS